jgi:hypothetical protein
MTHALVEVERNIKSVVENNIINLRTHINGFFFYIRNCLQKEMK